MTAITDDTPITTPKSVSTERSLLAHKDWRAIFTASLNSIAVGARYPKFTRIGRIARALALKGIRNREGVGSEEVGFSGNPL